MLRPLVLLTPYLELATSPRESLVAAYDCCMAHPTLSHTPQVTVVRGLWLQREEL